MQILQIEFCLCTDEVATKNKPENAKNYPSSSSFLDALSCLRVHLVLEFQILVLNFRQS